MMQGQADLKERSEIAAPVLRIGAVSKRFGSITVLKDCSLNIAEGEIVTLLGASGCGKTTLLRCIAGFWEAEAGKIEIDGHDVGGLPVNRRPVGVVFQSYALFPHLTVARNVGYGLRMRGTPRSEIDARVREVLETVSLADFADRYPAQLSGGQQQRVAVARVLILQPRVLLLDEPFSALDAKLRGTMQVELRQLIKRLGLTAIFVTHDQEEALTMSDRIAVMRAGRIEQVAAPDTVFDFPATAYVADFIGTSNFWQAEAAQGRVSLPDGQIVQTDTTGRVQVMTRPHNLRLSSGDTGPWSGKIAFHRTVGALVEYHVDMPDGTTMQVATMRQDRAPPLANRRSREPVRDRPVLLRGVHGLMSDVTAFQPAPNARLSEAILDKLVSGRGIWPAVPAIIVLMVVAVVPFVILLSLGFSDIEVSRGAIVSQTLSFAHLTNALSDPLYWITFQRSLMLAINTTLLCLLFGYPVAYLFLIGGKWTRRLILILTIAPLLTSGIVRTYAWLVILGGRGVVNSTLMSLGLIDQPLRIMNTHWAVLIGMVQIHLPVMILPLIAVMSRHEGGLMEASANLGATRVGTLRTVILPLSAPGIGTGAALVFTLSYTTFVVPQLLGGGNYLNAATMIYEQVVFSLEWSKGSVSSLILMVTCLIVLVVIAMLTNIFTRWTKGRDA